MTRAHKKYVERVAGATPKDGERRLKSCKLEQFRQWCHLYHPNLHAARSQEGLCDTCLTLKNEISSGKYAGEELEEKKAQLATHWGQARAQRRVMRAMAEGICARAGDEVTVHLPDQTPTGDPAIAASIAAATPDVGFGPVDAFCEDYGGNLTMPFYGSERPGLDYYAHNLNTHQFIQANLRTGVNHFSVYDERDAGKGCDAVCSMRLRRYLAERAARGAAGASDPEHLCLVLDNCCGQNKSKAVLYFFAFLSLFLYPVISLLFLISGHSHMAADVAMAQLRKAIGKVNVYTTGDLCKLANKCRSIVAEPLSACPGASPFQQGWETFLKKHATGSMPNLYTKSYFFEFTKGAVMMRQSVETPLMQAVAIQLFDPASKDAMLRELFGPDGAQPSNWVWDSVSLGCLSVVPKIELKGAKVKGLSKKYPMIPPEHLWFYPAAAAPGEASAASEAASAPKRPRPGPVGRPRNEPKGPEWQKSLLAFLSVKKAIDKSEHVSQEQLGHSVV